MIHDLIRYFTTLHWRSIYTLLAFGGTGAATSILLEFTKPIIKHLESRWGMDTKKLTITLLGLLSGTEALAGDIVSVGPQNLGLVTSHATEIMTIALAVYHFGGSKTYDKVRSYLKDFQNYLSTGILPSGFKPKS